MSSLVLELVAMLPHRAHLGVHVSALLQQFLPVLFELLQPLGVSSTKTLEEKQDRLVTMATLQASTKHMYLKEASQLVPLIGHLFMHLQSNVVQLEFRMGRLLSSHS